MIPALSKLSNSKSSSKEAFAVGGQEATKDQSTKGFFSRLFSSKPSACKTDELKSNPTQLQRKQSLWQRSKSFLRPKQAEVPVEDSLSTIDLPRVRKTHLPKLKMKGSGAALKVDFSGFVLGKPEVTVDTDALLQRMFDLNEQPYQQLRAKYVSSESDEGAYLSPVMTAVTLSELTKLEAQPEDPQEVQEVQEQIALAQQDQNQENHVTIEALHSEVEQQQQHYEFDHQNVFNDNPQLDSPLLSVSGTLEDDLSCSEDDEEIANALPTEAPIETDFDEDISDCSFEAQSAGSSAGTPSDWSISRLNAEFGVLDVKQPIRHSDGSIHFHLEDSDGGSAESIVFEDWRQGSSNNSSLEAPKASNFQSLESVPRAMSVTEPSIKARSVSNSLLTGKPRSKTLGARISQIVAIFERGLQEELNS